MLSEDFASFIPYIIYTNMKIKFYLTHYLYPLSLNSYFHLFLIILFFTLLQIYFYDPIFCDSAVEFINDMTYPLNSCYTHQEQSVNQDNLSFNESIEPKCLNVFTNYQDICRRKLFWISCVKGKGTFATYGEFKQSWNPNTKVLDEIRKELKDEIKTELYKYNLTKNTFRWIVKPNSRGRWRRP